MSTDAVVVGSGPNGLSAAIELARNGRSVTVVEANETIGGGCRSAELTLPGFVHDLCSAFHPMGAASPFFRSLELGSLGLEWIEPPLALAHPLDDGTAIVLSRSLDETARGLGSDGRAWRRLVAQLVQHWPDLATDALGPLIKIPQHPLVLARLGLPGLLSARLLARRAFVTERARALFAGLAAHSMMPLDAPLSASFGLMFAVTTHVASWPIARGGSQRIADALVAKLGSLGGAVMTRTRVRDIRDLDTARAYLFDTTPRQLDRIAGARLSNGYRGRIEAQLERFAPGFRDRVLARSAMGPAAIAEHNENYLGGDIGGGESSALQLFGRPVLSFDPYATSARDIFLCSSSTPPGGGVHGMCGYHAARSALRQALR